jgi:transcription elongation factor B subunit 1
LSLSGIVLEKVAEYFCYNFKNRNATDVPDMEIPPELCLELLMAADYLDSESLLCKVVELFADEE